VPLLRFDPQAHRQKSGAIIFHLPTRECPEGGRGPAPCLKGQGCKGTKIAEHHLVYAPYWRVSGMFFQWIFGREHYKASYGTSAWESFKKLRSNLWFRTFPAFDTSKWGLPSIGLRAQAVKVLPFNKQRMGSDPLLVRQTVPFKEAVNLVRHSVESIGTADGIDIEMVKFELVGERYSLLFFPFYCYALKGSKGKSMLLVDALSHKVIKGTVDVDEIKGNPVGDKIPIGLSGSFPLRVPTVGGTFHSSPMPRFTCARVVLRHGRNRGASTYRCPTGSLRRMTHLV